MKIRFYLLAAALLFGPLFLSAQTEGEEIVIPTEVSEPPYELGDLVVEQGYYIERGEGEAQINFRFIDNKIRVFWIDENGLIAEPEYDSATVRFLGSVRGRSYHGLSLLPSGAGLGASIPMYGPHLYSTILVFNNGEDEEPTVYNFRYKPEMDEAIDPTLETEN